MIINGSGQIVQKSSQSLCSSRWKYTEKFLKSFFRSVPSNISFQSSGLLEPDVVKDILKKVLCDIDKKVYGTSSSLATYTL